MVLVSAFKKIKHAALEGQKMVYHVAVRHLSSEISKILGGIYGMTFYGHVESEDLKCIVFLFRTLLSVFLDSQIDRLYQDGALPVRALFVWARCIIHVVTMVRVVHPQLVEGFEHELFADFLGVVKTRTGVRKRLLRRSMKRLQLLGDGIEIKCPSVMVSDNTLRILAILISEFGYNARVKRSVSVNARHWNEFGESICYTTESMSLTGHPMSDFIRYVSVDLVERSLQPLSALVGSRRLLSHSVAVWQAYSYIVMGYCDFACKGNFVNQVFQDGNQQYDMLLDLAHRGGTERRVTNAPTDTDGERMAVLRTMRLIHEVIFHLYEQFEAVKCVDGDATFHMDHHICGEKVVCNKYCSSIQSWLVLTIRILFMWHIHFLIHKILPMGFRVGDTDYYSSFLKMAAVTLHRFGRYMSAEAIDIFVTICLICLCLPSLFLESFTIAYLYPARCITPQIAPNEEGGGDNTFTLFTSSLNVFTRLQVVGKTKKMYARTYTPNLSLPLVTEFAYTTMKSMMKSQLGRSNRFASEIFRICAAIGDLGYRISFLLHLPHNPLESLFERYTVYNRRKKAYLGMESRTIEQIGLQRCADSACFNINWRDEAAVELLCAGVDLATRYLLNYRAMDADEMSLAFVLFYSVVILMEKMLRELAPTKVEFKCRSEAEVAPLAYSGSTAFRLLEAFRKLQLAYRTANLPPHICVSLMPVLAVGTAVVELLMYRLVQASSLASLDSEGIEIEDGYNMERGDWIMRQIVEKSCQCLIESPITDVVDAVNTLSFLAAKNAERFCGASLPNGRAGMKESLVTDGISPAVGGVAHPKPGIVDNCFENACLMEKAFVDSLVVCIDDMCSKDNTLLGSYWTANHVDREQLEDVFEACCRFIVAANILDVIYPEFQSVFALMNSRGGTGIGVEHILASCRLMNSNSRRLSALSTSVPLVVDTNHLVTFRRRLVETTSDISPVDVGGSDGSSPVTSPQRDQDCAAIEMCPSSVSMLPEALINTIEFPESVRECEEDERRWVKNDTLPVERLAETGSKSNEVGDVVPYVKRVDLRVVRRSPFCQRCRRRIRIVGVSCEHFAACRNCGIMSAMMNKGEMVINKMPKAVYVSTLTPLTTRLVLDLGMLPMGNKTTIGGTELDLQTMLSQLVTSTSRVSRGLLAAGDRAVISEDLSKVLAQYLHSTRSASHLALETAARLSDVGAAFALWLMNKQEVLNKLECLAEPGFHAQFFTRRLKDNMSIMSDASSDVDHLRAQYFCDALMLSLASSTRRPISEESCMDFWRNSPALTANLSVTTLSQAFECFLQLVVVAEANRNTPLRGGTQRMNQDICQVLCGAPPDQSVPEASQESTHYHFATAWLALSRLCNVVSIPLTRLLISGLSLTPARLALTLRSMSAQLPPMARSLVKLLLSGRTSERLEELHEGNMRGVLCTDENLQYTLTNCDYRLFQIMQELNDDIQPKDSAEQLRLLDKDRFYAMVRLLWYVTNPHVVIQMDATRGEQALLTVQSNYVATPFRAYLEMVRNCGRRATQITRVKRSGQVLRIEGCGQRSGGDAATQQARGAKDAKGPHASNGASTDRTQVGQDQWQEDNPMGDYLQENFVHILEYFAAVWINRGPQNLNFALKNKRLFYPEIYHYRKQQPISNQHVARAYHCIAILAGIHQGDIDVFCDRMIEVLTLRPIDAHNNQALRHCWEALARKISRDVLGLYAPGIAYHTTRAEDTPGAASPGSARISTGSQSEPSLIWEMKNRLKEVESSAGLCASVDCIVECVSHPRNLHNIEKKLSMLSAMVHSNSAVRIPYITREAAAVTANQLLEFNPFIFNIEHAKTAATKLAFAALRTIAEHSDDFGKNPTVLTKACCSILGYVPCDLGAFRMSRQRAGADLLGPPVDLQELAALVLKGYLIPNMHLQVALYSIQEILKLLNLYKGGGRSPAEVEEMGERWNRTFDAITRRAIEPYRGTCFLRNRAIEDVIETRLDVNTVLDIKSFVWWLLKMLPNACAALPLFRACDLAMVKIPSVLTFLLPYIVEACVEFLDEQCCAVIGKRMASLLCNILKRDSATFGINWQPPYEVVSRSGRTLDSTDQYTSCQAIFNLLDSIKVLTDRYRRELSCAQGGAGSSSSKRRKVSSSPETQPAAEGSAGSGREASNTKVLRMKMKRLDKILFAVPELLVAHAAISCGSYARGVMIIEKKLAFEPRSYNFGDPRRSLSTCALRANIDHVGLDPQAIISLLCRGYFGLGDFDSLVSISNIVLNDTSLKAECPAQAPAALPPTKTNGVTSNVLPTPTGSATAATSNSCSAVRAGDARGASISKSQRDACRAFSYECRGQFREACDVYNRLLKNSQDARLWANWYRIIQMTGPSVFIRLPRLPEIKEPADSLIAESLTACWKFGLWDELDELLEKKRSQERAILEVQAEESSGADLFLLDRSAAVPSASGSQLTQCADDGHGGSNVFWESLLMRDPIDVWFMEQTADAVSLLQKRNYKESEQTVQEGFKNLIRPLGLAIRESALVAVKYLEKVATLNALRLTGRFSTGKYETGEREFTSQLVALVQGSAVHTMRNVLNVLGTAKVALELGGKIDAAAELLVTLNRTCRVHDVDVHIPGSMSLDDEALAGRNDVVLEHALTLQHKGQVDEAVELLSQLARNDFEGFYNLVKIYSESNLLIPKRAISYMKEILQAAPRSFKANLLYAKYLDGLLDHRLRNAQNFRLVLDDATICSSRNALHTPVEDTYKITGIEGVPGVYSFVQLVAATVNAYLQSLAFVTPSRHGGALARSEHSGLSSGRASLTDYSDRTTGELPDADEKEPGEPSQYGSDCTQAKAREEGSASSATQDTGGNMDIVDILTKVTSIVSFYCTPHTTQLLSNVTFESESCQIFANAIMDTFFEYSNALPQYYWYAVISQLMSRCHHRFLGAPLFQTLVARLVARYPKMALWSTLYFAHSVNPRMRSIHANIERKAREIAPSASLVIEYHHSLFKELLKVAMDSTVSINDKSALRFQDLWRVLNSPGCREQVLIPTIRNLSFDRIVHYDQTEALSRLCGLQESMQVLRSKQKPKKIGFLTSTGQVCHFLVKNEIKGDLRKDKRMMEVTQYVAMLLKKKYSGMPLQCYSVVSLNEVAGIIEWVPNMATMRALVTDEHRRIIEGSDRESRADITRYAASVTAKNYTESLALFRRLCERRPPVLHRAYYNVFKRDPATWFCARKEFIHTCAVWSILGYIVGLGDRHSENILMNLTTGQVMHVDFDCLFGKGSLLAVPELVPFRMTQNVVCNLGVCGTATDGPFYSEALKFLQLLHRDRQKITDILMSFVYDPLIEWRRGEAVSNGDADSRKVLQCIVSKLRGALNVVIPSVQISSCLSASDDVDDQQGQQDFENVEEIMEPRQQLQQLIQVATSDAHLSKIAVIPQLVVPPGEYALLVEKRPVCALQIDDVWPVIYEPFGNIRRHCNH
ncbi:FATC domain-containing protein [Babesia caballi]|uniref:Serine/threonine-protein kinase ATR n=1 Tax=Babesia caballi TaxID=5871 RepID=A0AAV4LUC8_BABCB|nr:FATC domain-containing protein [Babesia caballi]